MASLFAKCLDTRARTHQPKPNATHQRIGRTLCKYFTQIEQRTARSRSKSIGSPTKNGMDMVKQGYKPTEIGVIPEEWNIFNFDRLTNENKGIKIGPFGSQLKKEYLTQKGYKVYGQENVYDNNFEIGDRFLSDDHFNK